MSRDFFKLNRPVHLARRDVCFERAVELLYQPMQEMGIDDRIEHVRLILELLTRADAYAANACRSPDALPIEADLLHFLQLISENVRSALAMMQQQAHLEEAEGFLVQFLSAKENDYNLPAMAYQRRSEDILQGLWHLLRLAHAPYRRLQQKNQSALDETEKERYTKATGSLRTELAS